MKEQTTRRRMVIEGEEVEYDHTNMINEETGEELSTPHQALLNTLRAFRETQKDLDPIY